MTSFSVSLVVELIVAGLLAATIWYCLQLNKRLTRLKADEQALKATIAELVTATEIAERAINGLKVTVRECDATLGERLRSAEQFVGAIDREVREGEAVLERVALITKAAREATRIEPAPAPRPAPEPIETPVHAFAASGAQATLAAASAFAARRQARAA